MGETGGVINVSSRGRISTVSGRCGHGSPCEQLCYELHDGMYECDCRDGYILHKNGYSCAELNSTASSMSEGSASDAIDSADQTFTDVEVESDENDAMDDILYMRGASFTIHLDLSKSNATSNVSHVLHRDKDTNELPGEERPPPPPPPPSSIMQQHDVDNADGDDDNGAEDVNKDNSDEADNDQDEYDEDANANANADANTDANANANADANADTDTDATTASSTAATKNLSKQHKRVTSFTLTRVVLLNAHFADTSLHENEARRFELIRGNCLVCLVDCSRG
ncbi:PREDICTED: dentin sialophosphoprotein-like [Ceratosolen solmsi marchali]|uniref:Dentin sialophosphoprotein-like n=1 Tax=Ceratosolen solmsi marchali TaxID=326594 RepID=A0AAJ6YIZ3_9HYME|nr:PREDICTED: dentin sialophosphoprotein-like [Ceratosolen solmsi marchali]